MIHQHFFSDQQLGFWHFSLGPQILFGRDELLNKLPPLCQGKRIGVLTDGTVAQLELTRQFLVSIETQQVASCWIGSDSDYADVCNACREFQQQRVELVLAIGGGSVLDAAKVVAAAFPSGLDPWTLGGQNELDFRPPLIAIPTTFGTGAEANMYSHLCDRESGEKISFKKTWLTPDFALVHPGFAQEMSQQLKYLSGIDAFVHVLEVLTLKRDRSPLLTQLLKNAFNLFRENFRSYVENPEPQQEEALAQVSTLGGIGIHNARTGLIHALAGPWAKLAGVPHTLSILPFIRPVMEFNWAQIAAALPFESLSACHEFLDRQVLFLPQDIIPLQLNDGQIRQLTEQCALDQVLFKENPRPLQIEDIENLYRQALLDLN